MPKPQSEEILPKAANNLAASLLEFAVQQSSVIYYIADFSGNCPVRFISSNVEIITGHKPEDFLRDAKFGRHHLHQDDIDGYINGIGSLAQKHKVVLEYRFATKDGDFRWFRDEVRLVESVDAKKEFVGCMIDITAEHNAKEHNRAVEERHQRLQEVLEDLPIGVVVFDQDDRVFYANRGLAISEMRSSYPIDFEGMTRDEFNHRYQAHLRSFDGMPARLTRTAIRQVSERSKTLKNDSVEIQLKDGSWRLVSGYPTKKGGQILISADITEQKEREAEIQLAHETLDDAIESLSEGLVLYDADDRLVMCNSQYKAFHKDSANLLIPGAHWEEVTRKRGETGLFAEANGRLEEWLQEQMALRGIAKNIEFRASNDRWFEYSHRQTHQGGFVSTWRDITLRKRMEQELRESEEMVRQVLEACPVAITMNTVEEGRILYESPAARELLASDRLLTDEAVLSRWVDLSDRQAYLKDLRQTGAIDNREIRYRRSNGQEFPCSLSSRLIQFQGQDVIVSNVVDLTERKAAAAKLEQQRELLHQNEKLSAMGELLAGVSHELNNPLSVLVGQALMLQETAPDEVTSQRAEKISKAADRCSRIVKSFLSMARQEPKDMVSVDVNAVIENALDITAYSLRTSGIDVTMSISPDLPSVLGDPDQLIQVLTNLIINAQHALQENDGPRRIHVTTSYRMKSGQVIIKVKDNGPGVPADVRSRIFEPLFTTKEIGAGTGIGLALCHRIVESHRGTIAIESRPGEGAIFAIRLPCQFQQGFAKDRKLQRIPTEGSSRILIIDDEPEVGQIIADILDHDDHFVEIAETGLSALEKVKRNSYDVVLCDIRMPSMDGPSFYQHLKELKPEQIAGLAFITGDTLSASVLEFIDASERPYLEKPVTPKELRELVTLLLRRKGN